jgi:hypothetical protein
MILISSKSRFELRANSRVPLLCLALLLTGCASTVPEQHASRPSIEIPLVAGWYSGQKVFYITTDISDLGMAKQEGANHVARLANALPPSPPDPSRGSSIDRIYKFFDGSQPSVLPSAPTPLGGGNSNDAYSPLWQLVKVTWLPGSVWTELRSEEEVLEAAETKRVSLERLPIIVNCPVVQVGDQLLPGTRRIR